MLDVDQCSGKYYTPNAFKRTHKCDDKTSYVSIRVCTFVIRETKHVSSVFQSLGVGSLQADISVNASKAMNIRLRILLTILTGRDWMLSS